MLPRGIVGLRAEEAQARSGTEQPVPRKLRPTAWYEALTKFADNFVIELHVVTIFVATFSLT